MTDKKSTPTDSTASEKAVETDNTDQATQPSTPEAVEHSAESKVATSKPSTATEKSAVKADDKTTAKASTSSKTAQRSQPEPPAPIKRSNKLAGFALFLALLAIAGVVGVFYWYQQQLLVLNQQASSKVAELERANQNQINGLIANQSKVLEAKIASAQQGGKSELAQVSKTISQLNQQVIELKDMRSSDWLLHEAQYLVRLASRALWLEDDTQGAITLLRDADNRLIELNDPNLLPLREVIHQDIEQLSLLPALESEAVILTLIGLEKQIEQLPLALAYKPDSAEQETDLTLSDNTDDWRENLAKSWQRLMDDFITVRRRTANVEPLLAPQQQQNLQQNLSLKLQVAQWAVTRKNPALFKQSIADVQAWLTTYYDADSQQVISFSERLTSLTDSVIDLPLPSKLRSLGAISQTLDSKTNRAPTQVPLLEKLPMPKPVSTDKDGEGNA
ncbi:uroporphyrinogen-III C-methyltransferase [Thalassotalea sp. LPB0316]|uniref:uroporphyrinogen-III C-methyltransferase n=1 Tax=Thalassotalea sp. LPB0316 TaxID=2769490 RepID=UPI0018661589|nr:uroporphyrinogen-III C-methyltransferase [Thalassotalea sp. LPB0316]QOL26303.1 uroporphyrinogen-III C-methyltransferase [Thalassotalea sp. LPB0316]